MSHSVPNNKTWKLGNLETFRVWYGNKIWDGPGTELECRNFSTRGQRVKMFLTRSEYDRYLVCYCNFGGQTRGGGRGGNKYFLSLGAPVVLCRVIKPKLQLVNLTTKFWDLVCFKTLCWPSHVILREYCKTSGLLSKRQKEWFKNSKPDLQIWLQTSTRAHLGFHNKFTSRLEEIMPGIKKE